MPLPDEMGLDGERIVEIPTPGSGALPECDQLCEYDSHRC
jgi:hypothetical protein